MRGYYNGELVLTDKKELFKYNILSAWQDRESGELELYIEPRTDYVLYKGVYVFKDGVIVSNKGLFAKGNKYKLSTGEVMLRERIVYNAFNGDCGRKHIGHFDGDIDNCQLSNLYLIEEE